MLNLFSPKFIFLMKYRILIATVEVLPENILPDSLYDCRSLSLDKHRLLPANGKNNTGFIGTLLSQKNIYEKQYNIPYSVWPTWVHRSYDLKFVTQVKLLLIY